VSLVATPVEPRTPAASDFETDIGQLLADLAAVQEELLAVLGEKRRLLASGNVPAIEAVQGREQALVGRLQSCQQRRAELLARAKREQRPGDSIESLSASLAPPARGKLGRQVKKSKLKLRPLQNESLTNWVLAQRLLLHVSQLLEIIATGGRLKPTYAEGNSSIHERGTLVNDEA
jgi:flagellar biosynthesis/type III secretory pathway chaperone